MKKIFAIIVTFLLLPIVNAQQTNDAGITPDSFLWGLDKALDQLNLLLTFDKAEKTKKGLEIARERLEEIKVMIEENKLDAAEKGKEEHGKNLLKVKQSIQEIEEDDSIEEIKEIIDIERELEEHDAQVGQTFEELKIKIEVEGEVTQQQKDLIDSILNSLKGQTGEVKVEIKNKKDKTKIKIKTETDKSEKEIDDEIEDIEKEKGLADIKKEKAAEEIDDAKEDLEELEKDLEEHKAEGHVADETPITTLIDNAKKRLSNADEAFSNNDFGEAFGQANAAEQLIENAERILEKVVEQFEEDEEEQETDEREIEVEIEDGEAKVKIEIGDAKLKFTLETTDKDAIIQEIATRTGLSIDDVTSLAEFEEEVEIEEETGVEDEEEIDEQEDEEKNEDEDTILILNEKVSLKCNSDDDCLLINKDLSFGCCWAGTCDSIDYSLEKYIAVNKESFIEVRKENCPDGDILGSGHTGEEKTKKYDVCGPASSCPTQLINDNFIAKCVNDICTKVPK